MRRQDEAETSGDASLGCVGRTSIAARLLGKARLNASDAQDPEPVLVGRASPGGSAVTSMRDAAHCLCLRIVVNTHLTMDGRNGWGTLELEAVLKDSILNASVCDHPFPGAVARERSRQSSPSTFGAPTIPVGLRSPLAAALLCRLWGMSYI